MTQSYKQRAGFPYKVEVIYRPPTEEDWEQINNGLESLASIVADLILEERRKDKYHNCSQYDKVSHKRVQNSRATCSLAIPNQSVV